MKLAKAAQVREKMKKDKALNLSELALVSGYDRGTLAAMLLPLVAGKIFYTDFRRILCARQDRFEADSANAQRLTATAPLVRSPAFHCRAPLRHERNSREVFLQPARPMKNDNSLPSALAT